MFKEKKNVKGRGRTQREERRKQNRNKMKQDDSHKYSVAEMRECLKIASATQLYQSGLYQAALEEIHKIQLSELKSMSDHEWYWRIKFSVFINRDQMNEAFRTLSDFARDMETNAKECDSETWETWESLSNIWKKRTKQHEDLIMDKSKEDLKFTTCEHFHALIKVAILDEMRIALMSLEFIPPCLVHSFIQIIQEYIDIDTCQISVSQDEKRPKAKQKAEKQVLSSSEDSQWTKINSSTYVLKDNTRDYFFGMNLGNHVLMYGIKEINKVFTDTKNHDEKLGREWKIRRYQDLVVLHRIDALSWKEDSQIEPTRLVCYAREKPIQRILQDHQLLQTDIVLQFSTLSYQVFGYLCACSPSLRTYYPNVRDYCLAKIQFDKSSWKLMHISREVL